SVADLQVHAAQGGHAPRVDLGDPGQLDDGLGPGGPPAPPRSGGDPGGARRVPPRGPVPGVRELVRGGRCGLLRDVLGGAHFDGTPTFMPSVSPSPEISTRPPPYAPVSTATRRVRVPSTTSTANPPSRRPSRASTGTVSTSSTRSLSSRTTTGAWSRRPVFPLRVISTSIVAEASPAPGRSSEPDSFATVPTWLIVPSTSRSPGSSTVTRAPLRASSW